MADSALEANGTVEFEGHRVFSFCNSYVFFFKIVGIKVNENINHEVSFCVSTHTFRLHVLLNKRIVQNIKLLVPNYRT